jgi:hypothetical protein
VTTTLSRQQLSVPTRWPRPQQHEASAPPAETGAPQRREGRGVAPHREAHRAPQREEVPLAELTDELEPINETTAHIRRVDETLRRFAAVHEEVAEEERRKQGTRGRLRGLFSRADDLPTDGAEADLADEAEARDAERVSHRHRTRESSRIPTKAMTTLAVLLVLAVAVVLAVVAM